jgi:hypothetical protein
VTPLSVVRAAILAAELAAWPGPHGDTEAPECRQERLGTIALATELETHPAPPAWRYGSDELRDAALVVTWWESGRWRLDVHDGRRKGDRGRSACLGQIMRGAWYHGERWRALMGTDMESTRQCVRAVVRVLTHHANRCLPSWQETLTVPALARVLSGYASGYSCGGTVGQSQARAWHWWRVRQMR